MEYRRSRSFATTDLGGAFASGGAASNDHRSGIQPPVQRISKMGEPVGIITAGDSENAMIPWLKSASPLVEIRPVDYLMSGGSSGAQDGHHSCPSSTDRWSQPMQVPSRTPVFSRISSLEVIGLSPVVEFDYESRVDVLVSTIHICQPVEASVQCG